jgi:hypothetical protein
MQDMEIPPGFESCKVSSHAASSFGVYEEIKGSLKNALFVTAKGSLFKHFQQIISDELTDLICPGARSHTHLAEVKRRNIVYRNNISLYDHFCSYCYSVFHFLLLIIQVPDEPNQQEKEEHRPTPARSDVNLSEELKPACCPGKFNYSLFFNLENPK